MKLRKLSIPPQDRPKLLFASLCALAAAGLSGSVYLERDSLFHWEWARAHGAFVEDRDEELRLAARDLAEAENPGKACVEQWLGKDDKFVYLGLGCAVFRRHLGELVAEGDEVYFPARLRYSGGKVSGLERVSPGPAFANGLRRLFPQKVAALWKAHLFHGEYEARGITRMEERGQGAGR